MKKLSILGPIMSITMLGGQNLQIHYDLGENREYVTSTLEMFKPDEYGATFWFVDFDYNFDEYKGTSLAYWEIARYFNLPFVEGLSATIQYNDGLLIFSNPDENSFMNHAGDNLGQTWLFGFSYPINLGGFTFSADVLYRNTQGGDSGDIQLTWVWFTLFMNGKIQFSGYYDIWSKNGENGKKEFVHFAEPQLWYNLNKHIAVGGELEINKNFISNDLKFNPTVGFKWIF